jgi:hypothetical protein
MLGSQDGVLEPKHCSPRLGHPAPHEGSQELHDRQQEGDVGIKCRVETPWSCSLERSNLASFNLLPGAVGIGGIGGLCPPGEDRGGDFLPSRRGWWLSRGKQGHRGRGHSPGALWAYKMLCELRVSRAITGRLARRMRGDGGLGH